MVVRRAAALTTVLAVAGALVAASPAGTAVADEAPVVVLQKKLDGPFGLDKMGDGTWVVAQSVSGKVTRLGPSGFRNDLVRAPGVSGVAVSGNAVFSVLGGGDETGQAPPGPYPPTTVLRTDMPGKNTRVLANLRDYELANNPDGQPQFRPKNGKPYDSLSNPFSITSSPWGLLVADGGANDVLLVDPQTGAVSTFFVAPNVTDVAGCRGHQTQANAGVRGCDSVPTGVAVVGDSVYVSTLGAEVPGAGRVYRLDSSGQVQRIWGGLTSPTGVAVDPGTGDVFVSEALYGGPQGPPGPGFDPSQVGRITKIASDGSMSYAQVTMPTGLRFYGGKLYSTAWSIAFFLGIQRAGQVVQVNPSAFEPAP